MLLIKLRLKLIVTKVQALITPDLAQLVGHILRNMRIGILALLVSLWVIVADGVLP